MLTSPGLPPSPRPPFSSCPTRLPVLWAVTSIWYRLKRAVLFLVLIFILGGEHGAAGEPGAVHRGEAGVAAEAAPALIARVAVTRRAIAGGAVAGGAVA